MKKIKRIIAVLLLCVIAVSCAGCAELDEMRAHHAIWLDEAQLTLDLNGVLYKRLPANSYFEIWTYEPEDVFVTNADVPLLLSKQFGNRMCAGKDMIFLESMWQETDRAVYYCREDHYDETVRQITQGVELDLIIYDFWSFETGKDITYTLTAEQKAAVETVLKSKPTSLGINGFNEDYSVYLYRCSSNYLFRDMLGCISVLNGEYRLILNNESEDLCYSVPAELKPQFEKILEKYMIEYENV